VTAPLAKRLPLVALVESTAISACSTTDADPPCGTAAPTAVRPIAAAAGPGVAGQPRRRGRPPKVRQQETDFVEWWKPGWREKL
jgi:hypothetical protein